MKDITLIIMAAGDSVRFCSSRAKGTLHANTHFNHTFHNENIESSNKPSTKKQWLRLGTMPLWYFVTHNLASQILDILNTLQQAENATHTNTHQGKNDTKCNNKNSESNPNKSITADTQNQSKILKRITQQHLYKR